MQLVGEDYTGERETTPLSFGCLCQEVGIAAEQHSPERCRPIEELGIDQAARLIPWAGGHDRAGAP